MSSSYSGLSSSVVKSATEEFLSDLTFFPIGSLSSIDTVTRITDSFYMFYTIHFCLLYIYLKHRRGLLSLLALSRVLHRTMSGFTTRAQTATKRFQPLLLLKKSRMVLMVLKRLLSWNARLIFVIQGPFHQFHGKYYPC